MNDFTKEELIELLEYCNAWAPPGLGMSDDRVKTWLKIQYMIDNYCEHDYKTIDNDFIVKKIKVCTKCGSHKS